MPEKVLKCKQCGFCCQNFSLPPVTEMKNPAAARALLKMFDFPLADYLDTSVHVKVGLVVTESPCHFFNPFTKLCGDYLGRPEICRQFFCKKCEEPDGTIETSGDGSEGAVG
ncbi:MAG: YkgJ family cysteine cluster protein [Bacteroidales bacterium]